MHAPAYIINDFEEACRNDLKEPDWSLRNVKIDRKVVKEARNDFNLNGWDSILSFFGNREYSDLEFVNQSVYRNSNITPQPMVDAYTFLYVSLPGYFAFYREDRKWKVKSLHKDREHPMYCAQGALQIQLQKLLEDKRRK